MSRGSYTVLVIGFATLISTANVMAQDQPIQSPQDAACRDEARDQLVSTPNPQGLSFYNLGAQIYRACMKRTDGPALEPRERRNR